MAYPMVCTRQLRARARELSTRIARDSDELSEVVAEVVRREKRDVQVQREGER